MKLNVVAAAVAALTPLVVLPAVAGPLDGHPAVRRALALIKAQPQAALLAAADRFEALDVVRDADGATHVRLDRRFKGLRVIGGDLVVHIAPDQKLKSISQTLARGLSLDTTPSFSEAEARSVAADRFEGRREAGLKTALVVYAREDRPELAWDILATGTRASGLPSERHFIVSAHSGALLDEWDDVQTVDALGTGTGFYTGTVPLHGDQLADGSYQLVDQTRGGQTITDMNNKGNVLFGGPRGKVMTDPQNVWGSGTASDRTTAGVDAAYGIAQTWDYYLQNFDRHGIRNDGVGAEGRVHWAKKLTNAAWNTSCFCMRYGDGDGKQTGPVVAIDIAGHEMTHGVTAATAGLIYSKESGGLNESMSDVFGTMVEYFANNPNSAPNYKIGERIYLDQSTGAAFRYMYHPSSDSSAPKSQSADCWYSGVGSLDPHYSSGVGNHAFYLIAEGSNPVGGPASPTCRAGDQKVASGTGSVIGIGRTAAQRIWYRALTVYMTKNTTYAGARTATISAATDLYGANSTQTAGVKAGWSAVNVE